MEPIDTGHLAILKYERDEPLERGGPAPREAPGHCMRRTLRFRLGTQVGKERTVTCNLPYTRKMPYEGFFPHVSYFPYYCLLYFGLPLPVLCFTSRLSLLPLSLLISVMKCWHRLGICRTACEEGEVFYILCNAEAKCCVNPKYVPVNTKSSDSSGSLG